MAHIRLTPRQYMILGLVALCAPLGDTCLSRGMTHLPPISLAHPLIADQRRVYAVDRGGHCAADRILCELPDGAFVGGSDFRVAGNGVWQCDRGAAVARSGCMSRSRVQRWAGIVLITVGVGFVANGPSRTERAEHVNRRTRCAQVAEEHVQ